MQTYRFSLPAVLRFSVEAADEAQAQAKAREAVNQLAGDCIAIDEDAETLAHPLSTLAEAGLREPCVYPHCDEALLSQAKRWELFNETFPKDGNDAQA